MFKQFLLIFSALSTLVLAQGNYESVVPKLPKAPYIYEPLNIGSSVSDDLVIFSGAYTQEKTDDESLGSKRKPARHMVWEGITDLIIYPDAIQQPDGGGRGATDFVSSNPNLNLSRQCDNNLTYVTKTIFTGNGFNGNACRGVLNNASGNYLGLSMNWVPDGTYKFSFKYRSNQTLYWNNFRSGSGDTNGVTYDTSFIANTGNPIYIELGLTIDSDYHGQWFIKNPVLNTDYIELDEINLWSESDEYNINEIADSVYGISKILQNPIQGVQYRFRQTISYTSKDETFYWKAAPWDTVTIPEDDVYLASVSDGDSLWLQMDTEADSILISRGTTSDTSTFSVIATIVNASEYYDSDVTPGVTYFYRLLGKSLANIYSANWSNVLSATVTSDSSVFNGFSYTDFPLDFGTLNFAEDTITAGGGGEYGGIVVIDAETGDLTQLSSTNLAGTNTLAASEGSKNNESYGFIATWDGSSSDLDGIYNLSDLTAVYGRIYFYVPASIELGTTNNNIYIFSLWDGGTVLMRMGLGFGTPATNWASYVVRGQNVTNTTNTGVARTTDAWHRFEFVWTAGTGADGISQCWVDGTQILDETDNANSAYAADAIYFGGHYVGLAAGQTMYFDDLVLDNDSLPGVYSGGGGDPDTVLSVVVDSIGIINNLNIVSATIDSISGLNLPFELINKTFPDEIAVNDTSWYSIQTYLNSAIESYYDVVNIYGETGGTLPAVVFDQFEVSATIVGEAVPDSVTGLAFTDTTETSISLICDGVSGATGYRFAYKTSAGSTWTNILSSDTIETISGLNGSTAYDFRVQAYNGTGNGVWSAVISVSTLTPAAVPAQVTGLEATFVNVYDAGARWSDLPDEVGYEIWLREASAAWSQVGTNVANDTVYAPFILQPSTTYYIKVLAYNDAGDGEFSDSIGITTLEIPPALEIITYDYNGTGSDVDDGDIWLHPSDKSKSVIIGSDKGVGRLHVWDLVGNLLYTYSLGWTPGNIQILYEFPLDGESIDIACVNNRDDDEIWIYKIDSTDFSLTEVGIIDISGVFSYENYGTGVYRSPYDTTFHVGIVDYRGNWAQWELEDDAGEVQAVGDTYERRITSYTQVDSIAEGNDYDWETGKWYIAYENQSIHKIAAEPDSSTAVQLRFGYIGTNGIVADLEGLAIYYKANGKGYIFVSNQGADNIKVFTRELPHTFVGTISYPGSADGDGLFVTNVPLGNVFPNGALFMHNGTNAMLGADMAQFDILELDPDYWTPRIGLEAPMPVSDSLFTFTSAYNFGSVDSALISTNYILTIDNNSGITLPLSLSGLSSPFKIETTPPDSLADGVSTNVTISFNHNATPAAYSDTLVITGYKTQYCIFSGTVNSAGTPFEVVIRDADYYVDATNGSNSNNGLTPQTAKQSISGIISLGSAISGKTVAFRDSMYYRYSSTWDISYSNVTITNWYEGGSYRLPRLTPTTAITGFSDQGGNVWLATGVSSAPGICLIYSGLDTTSYGLQRGSQGALDEEGEYYQSGSNFYIYCPSDPDDFYESVNIINVSTFIDITASGCALRYLRVFGATSRVVRMLDSGNNGLFENCWFHHAGDWSAITGGGGSANVLSPYTDNNIFRKCIISHWSDHSIHWWASQQSIENNLVEYCLMFIGAHSGLDQNGGTNSGLIMRYNWAGRPLYFKEFYDMKPWTGGMTFLSTTSNNLIHHNVCFNATHWDAGLGERRGGSLLYSASSGETFHHNTFINPLYYSGGGYGIPGDNSAVHKNEVLVQNSPRGFTGIGGGSSNNIQYNIYGSSGTNPDFVDLSTMDLRLDAGSPAIGYGTDLGYTTDINGFPLANPPSAGAFEYGSVRPTPTTRWEQYYEWILEKVLSGTIDGL